MAPRASRLGAAILEKTGIKPRFIPIDQSGFFEVHLNGALIFSRDLMGRYPSAEEILSQIANEGE